MFRKLGCMAAIAGAILLTVPTNSDARPRLRFFRGARYSQPYYGRYYYGPAYRSYYRPIYRPHFFRRGIFGRPYYYYDGGWGHRRGFSIYW